MGQRLVVTIQNNGRSLAKLYYHWSAYTGDALYVTREIIRCIYNGEEETERDLLLRLIRFCEHRGGGIDGGATGEEWQYITAMYPDEVFKSEGINRSNGIIAISGRGMTEMQLYSEGDVFIDLTDDSVDFCVYGGYESLDEYIEERKSWDDEFEGCTLEDIPYLNHCLGYFNVNEIDDIIRDFEAIDDYYGIIRCDNEIVELI